MRKLIKTTSIFLICALALSSCKKDIKDLLENDLMFNMDANAFLQNQVQFQFVNANGANAVAPKPSISISGKDAPLVFDINGGNTIKLEGQFARLVVSPGTPLSDENPATFKIKAVAPGFLPYEQDLTIHAADSFMTYTLEMVELNNAPQGFRYTTATGAQMLIGNEMKVGKAFGNGFSASVSMPKGNGFINEAGTIESINKIELVQFDANEKRVSSKIQNLIPNFTDKISVQGNETDLSFYPIGYVQMKVNGKQERVAFDKPATMQLYVAEGTVDPLTNEALKVGDAMQVYQWDETQATWKFLSDASLNRSADGNLVVEATVGATNVVALVTNPTLQPITGRTCRTNLGVQFKRNSNVNTKHFVMVVAANDSSKVYAYASDVIVANNTTFNFTRRLPTNLSVRVIVYEYEQYSFRGKQLAVSAPFTACNFTTSRRLSLNVNPPTASGNAIARFELDTYCPTSRLFYYHEGRIEYRLKGSIGPWADLGLARRSGRTITEIVSANLPSLPPVSTTSFSFLETDRLENGKLYEFRVTITGRPRRGRGNITRTFIKTRKFDVTEFEALTGRTPATYQYLKFKRGYWLANADDNQNPCAIWGY
jgi:hypothetical protein